MPAPAVQLGSIALVELLCGVQDPAPAGGELQKKKLE
jgi:hypothetical protein